MMCFPKMKQCFCCCSLRTGMFFICWMSLFWNLFFLYVANDGTPLILEFLDKTQLINLPDGTTFGGFTRLYYVTQIMVMTFALIGIYSNSTCCLNLLIGSETLIFLTYVFMTLYSVLNTNLTRSGPHTNPEDFVGLFFISIFKYYVYLIILSFYHEVSQGRDGTGRGGIVITSVTSTSYTSPPSAPHVTDVNTLPTAPFIDSPYAVQPPHAPIMPQPCTTMYPPSEFPHVVIQTDVAPCAPPPYPILPQTGVLNEKPPPYAP